MKENERVGGEDGEENECPDLYGALNVENTATSIEVRVFFDLRVFFLHHSNVQKTRWNRFLILTLSSRGDDVHKQTRLKRVLRGAWTMLTQKNFSLLG